MNASLSLLNSMFQEFSAFEYWRSTSCPFVCLSYEMISLVFVSCSWRAFNSSNCFLVSFSRSWSQSSNAKVNLSWSLDLSQWFSFNPCKVFSYSISVVALSKALCYCSATIRSSLYWSSFFLAFSNSFYLLFKS